MKNNDTNKQVEKFPVKEGKETGSAVKDNNLPIHNYPELAPKDKQVKDQPEFTEEQPNRKSPNSPAK